MGYQKIRSFTDLTAWQEGHKLVLAIYNLTNRFPQQELYALTSQMRRASVSITSNLAEGFSRKSPKEKIQFYYTALGSLSELQSQLLVAKDIGYLDHRLFQEISELMIVASKLVNGLIKSMKIKQSLNT